MAKKARTRKGTARKKTDVHNAFDKVSRYILALDPIGYLAPILFIIGYRFTFLRWLQPNPQVDTDGVERIGDGLVELFDEFLAQLRFAVAVEFQFKAERDMVGRMNGYISRFRQFYGPLFNFFGCCVLLYGKPVKGDRSHIDMSHEHIQGQSRFEPRIVIMGEFDAEDTLNKIETGELRPCWLYWISLMQKGDQPDIIKRWKELVKIHIASNEWRNLGIAVLTLSEPLGRLAIWERELEDWSVFKSQVFETLTKVAKERVKDEGRDEGRKEGRKEGLETSRTCFFAAFERCFGRVPEEVATWINAQEELDVLNKGFQAAMKAASVDEFKTVVGIATPAKKKPRSARNGKSTH